MTFKDKFIKPHTHQIIVEELGHTYCDVSDPGECGEDWILIHFLPLQMF